MDRILADIEFILNEKLEKFKAYTTTPALHFDRYLIDAGNGQFFNQISRQRWENITFNFIYDFSKLHEIGMIKWLREGETIQKREIKITANNTIYHLYGTFPVRYNMTIDDNSDGTYSGITKNNNNLQRKVLFEKIGNRIITTSLEVELAIDYVQIID